MKTLAHTLILLILIAFPAFAQGDLGAVALHQSLLDMSTDLRLMCVAAHPDDEDGATLAYYRMHRGVKTYTVVATRGEGGQNEIGPELYNDLAVIRTHEMADASTVTGAELHFLDLPEFGFSKSSEEAFAIWGREETLRRLVRVIRETRPDVIITNHDTTHGHGQHQAIGIALIEAFDAAADPTRFPEQLAEGLQPWQPKRLLVRQWEGISADASVDIYAFDSARGMTYADVAAEALRRHRSQGMQFFIDRYTSRTVTALYDTVKETVQALENNDLFSGIADRVAPEDASFAQMPIPDLCKALPAYVSRLEAERASCPEAQRRWERANDVAAKAAELRLEATPSDAEVVAGQTVTLRASLTDFGLPDATEASVRIKSATWFPLETPEPITVQSKDGRFEPAELSVRIPVDIEATLPTAAHLFLPHFLEPQLTVAASVYCASARLELELPVHIEVAPPVSLRFAETNYLSRVGLDTPLRVELIAENHAPGPSEINFTLTAQPSLRLDRTEVELSFLHEGERKVIPIDATWTDNNAPGETAIRATDADGRTLAATNAVQADVALPKDVRIGVVQSYDDTLVRMLDRLNVPHEALTEEDFAPERLDAFTTILVDIRAYLVRPDLAANNAALLEYVRRGGHLVVMYQKTFEWKPEYAPYPLEISTNRVTREDAPVTLLQPEHPFFTTPNRITSSDWDGWIQERGLYFAGKWDPHYTPLIRTVDPGDDIPDGSFLVAPYGDGTYTYTALVWYRQLRALNPGALRLFANLLAQ